MTKIEINQTEYKPLVEVLNKAKTSVPLGYVLGSFMGKIDLAIRQEREKQLKEQYTNKKK